MTVLAAATGTGVALLDVAGDAWQAEVTAPESGSESVWVVIDSANLGGTPPASGAFTLRVQDGVDVTGIVATP